MSGRLRTLLERAALLLGGAVIAMGLLEAALRLLDVQVASYHSIAGFTLYDPELGWKLAPGRATVFKGKHFSVNVVHNTHGLRDQEYAYERAPGRRRILVLGDSVVWCWGVEQADCFTERLEASLPDTDVINAGVPGYSTSQELLYYAREGRRYRSDVVLLVMAPNDPADNVSSSVPRFRVEESGLRLGNVPVPRRKTAAQQWLQEHSRLFAHMNYLVSAMGHGVATLFARERAPRASEPVPEDDAPPATQGLVPAAPAHESEAWLLTEALLQRLAASVRADGARFAIVMEAMPVPMRQWLHERCVAWRIPCLDAAPALESAERKGRQIRLEGDPHLAVAGQEVLTQGILDLIDRERLLP